MTSRTGALSGPKVLKVPGSPEWCWQTVQVLKEQMRHVHEQWRVAEAALDELGKAKAWDKIPPDNPYGSMDAMLKAEVGLPAKEVRRRITQAADRAKALEGKTITDGRRERHSLIPNPDNIRVSDGTGWGTDPGYLARRIARDHPDIFKRMAAGDFPSVRAAALEAGIIHPTATVRTDDPTSAARTLRKHMTPEQCAELARLLTEA